MAPIRVLVADDSLTMRSALQLLLGQDPAISVVASAQDGLEAVELAKRLRPDVITMDVQMPRLDGLEATAAIMASVPSRILMVCSLGEHQQQELSFRAMSAGALEVIAKPFGSSPQQLERFGAQVRESVKLMAEVPVVTRRRLSDTPVHTFGSRGRIDILGIAASTGGPPALAEILARLPKNLPIPVLIAQHMADGFAEGLVRWLGGVTPLPVEIVRESTPPVAGRIYLPPDRQNLFVNNEGLLQTEHSPGGHCPSADRLLTSLAQVFGSRSGGLVLTGMGEDGSQGLLAIRKAGGATLAQDEATSVVYGMPRAAWESGAAEARIPLHEMAGMIRKLCELVGIGLE